MRIETCGLGFVDHHALTQLDELLVRAGRTTVLATTPPALATLGRLLRLRALRLEEAPANTMRTS